MTTRRIRSLASALARATAFGALALGCAALALEAYVWSLSAPDLARARKTSAAVLAEDNRVLKAFLSEDQIWRLHTTVQDVPPHYVAMLLAYEDQRFFQHRGVDALAVLRATAQMLRHGRIVSGASTLTMQTVRLLEKQEP